MLRIKIPHTHHEFLSLNTYFSSFSKQLRCQNIQYRVILTPTLNHDRRQNYVLNDDKFR